MEENTFEIPKMKKTVSNEGIKRSSSTFQLISGIGAKNYDLEKSLAGYSPIGKREEFLDGIGPSELGRTPVRKMSQTDRKMSDIFDINLMGNTTANIRQFNLKQE